MSSTNRSNARDIHIADYYITPIKDIINFLKESDNHICWDTNGIILDPCAGGDHNHTMSYPTSLNQWFKEEYDFLDKKLDIRTIDIREDSLAGTKGDYLQMELDYKPSIIITNPPFNIALDIIKKALQDVKDNGWVIMLLRLNFFETKDRKPFWDEYMSEYAFVHHKRMGFTDEGGTDSVAYMHCCWKKCSNPEFCKIKVI